MLPERWYATASTTSVRVPAGVAGVPEPSRSSAAGSARSRWRVSTAPAASAVMVSRTPLCCARAGLEGGQPLRASGPAAGGSWRPSVAAPRRRRRSARAPARAASRAPSRVARRAARSAAQRGRAAAPAARPPPPSRSFSAVARARPSIPAIASSREVAPRITAIGSASPWTYRSRNNTATRLWDAVSERRMISVCLRALASSRARRAERSSSRARSARARASADSVA